MPTIRGSFGTPVWNIYRVDSNGSPDSGNWVKLTVWPQKNPEASKESNFPYAPGSILVYQG